MASRTPTLRSTYKRFDLPLSATPEQVHAAYRRLSKQLHPDTGGSTSEFDVLLRQRDILLKTAADRRYRDAILRAERRPFEPFPTQSARTQALRPFTPGVYPALAIAAVSGLAGLATANRNLIVRGLWVALGVWLVVTAVLTLRALHRRNLESPNYLSAEEVVAMRDNRAATEPPARSRRSPRLLRVSSRISLRNALAPRRGHSQ